MGAKYTPNLLDFLFSSHFGQELFQHFHYLSAQSAVDSDTPALPLASLRPADAGGCVGVPSEVEAKCTWSEVEERMMAGRIRTKTKVSRFLQDQLDGRVGLSSSPSWPPAFSSQIIRMSSKRTTMLNSRAKQQRPKPATRRTFLQNSVRFFEKSAASRSPGSGREVGAPS